MITSQHVADGSRGFAERLVIGEVILIHGVKYTPLTGLHTVAHIGQRSADNYGHGVFKKGLSDLLVHVYRRYFLIGKFNIAILVHSFYPALDLYMCCSLLFTHMS